MKAITIYPSLIIIVFITFACHSSSIDEPTIDKIDDAFVYANYGLYGSMFYKFWKIMDTSYIYKNSSNIDWQETKNTYLKRMKHIKNDQDFGQALYYLVSNELNDPTIQIEMYGVKNYASTSPINNHAVRYYSYGKSYGKYGTKDNSGGIYISKNALLSTLYYSEDKTDNNYIHIYPYYGNTVEDNGEFAFILSKIMKTPPKGFIIDLRGYDFGNISNWDIDFLSYFYPQTKNCFIATSTTTIKNICITGKGVVATDIPIVLIVNEDVVGKRDIMAHALASLPNTITIGNSTGGYGAITRRMGIALGKESTFILTYPICDIQNDVFGSFSNPLQTDIFVEEKRFDNTIDTYDRCVEVAIELIYEKSMKL